jgi:hypothetical protein
VLELPWAGFTRSVGCCARANVLLLSAGTRDQLRGQLIDPDLDQSPHYGGALDQLSADRNMC